MTTYSFTTTPDTLKALLLHAPAKGIRRYLIGIAVDLTDPTSPVLAAADGYRMLTVDLVQHAGAESTDVQMTGDLPGQRVAIIPRDLIAAAVKSRYPVITFTLSTVEDGRFARVTVAAGTTTLADSTVVGVYPDYRRALPSCVTRWPADVVAYNVDYMHDAVTALQLLRVVNKKRSTFPACVGCWTDGPEPEQRAALAMPLTDGVRFAIAAVHV